MDQFPIPLNALRAIEIVARTGALKPAADELGVTIGAVSQHIRRAEARLGLELFVRGPRGLVPTPELAAMRGRLTQGFTTLLDATQALTRSSDDVLTVTMGSVFASRWLIKRLPHFSAAHPGIELVDSRVGYLQRAPARAAMDELLAKHGRIDGVWTANDMMAFGAVDALAAAGRPAPVVGINGLPEAIANIERGTMLATADFSALNIATIATRAVLRHLEGKTVPPEILVPAELIDRKGADANRGNIAIQAHILVAI